jgi:hypothetical protein
MPKSYFLAVAFLGAATVASGQERNVLTVPATVPGSLGEGDSRTSDGSPFDDYRLRLTKDQRFLLYVRSTDLDPMVQIFAPDDLTLAIATDDDGGEGLDASLVSDSQADGEVILRVTSFSPSANGNYTLSVTGVAPPADLELPAGRPADLNRAIVDGQLPTGSSINYRFWLEVGDEAIFQLHSTAFDAVLGIFDDESEPDAPLAFADDTEGSFDPILVYTASKAGPYFLRVGAADAGGGAYTLRVIAPSRPAPGTTRPEPSSDETPSPEPSPEN